ncbi:hypothetical protein Moror_6684 [Moniliophthora roreri MCA 2997]|uniref:Uncharacterized protein n=1 Tax=Moniliophthora roreri (strain MCA 2997) TaxID=1381753 RepID=V2YYI8_MONRO|nr:hypothetical protein Moror_6684 [Moniliophthora roreri MCA 2997]
MLHARNSASSIASCLKGLYLNSASPHRSHLGRVFDGLLEPCLKNRSHMCRTVSGRVHTVKVPFHDYENMDISDYFSGLGYFLTHLDPRCLSFTHLVKLLSQYAEWCRVSSVVLNVNTPTVVQLLSDASGRYSLAASVSAGKGGGREDVREERIKTLEAVWPRPLIYPTPVQQAHANAGIGYGEPSAEMFGTPWGHCGETLSFASMFKTMHRGQPLGTLALGVKPMNSIVPGTNMIPVYAIQELTNLKDIVQVLRVSGAMRSMCLNCVYLTKGATIEDYAVTFAKPENDR